MSKINILYVIENIFFGGGERVFAQIISGLDRDKYSIYVACLPGGVFEEKIKHNAEIIHFDLRKRFSLENIRKLSNIIRNKNIDIVHCQGGRGGFFSRIAAGKAKAPVISTVAMPVEGFNVGILKKLFYVSLDRYSERFVDKFIVVNEELKKRLIEKHMVPPERVVKIYNGIEIDEYIPDIEAAKSIRQELNIDNNTMLIATIGRLAWQKGLSYFVHAAKDITKIYHNIKFLIVGEGEEKEILENLVRKLDIEKKVIFTGLRKDIRNILNAIDIFVLPSIREGQPIVLLEAMAMQKPIVASAIEGVQETVEDGLSALLVSPRNPQQLTEAIDTLLNNREKGDELGQAARKTACSKFNIKDKIEQHQCLYETIITKRRES